MNIKDLISALGYSKNSPFKSNPYLQIYSPEGLIDMSQTDQDLMGIDEFGNKQLMKKGSKKQYKFPGQQITEIPVAQKGGIPTSQDSLNLYNAQINLNKFYEKEQKLGRLKKVSERNSNKYYFDYVFNNLNDENLKFYRDNIEARKKYTSRGQPTLYDSQYKDFFNLSPSQLEKLEYQGISKTKSGNDNIQYYRDIITPMQNLAAPFAMIDKRILPKKTINYEDNGYYPGGAVQVFEYDPLEIKPYNLLTPEEKIKRDKKSTGTKTLRQITQPLNKQVQLQKDLSPQRTNFGKVENLFPENAANDKLYLRDSIDVKNYKPSELPYRVSYRNEQGEPAYQDFMNAAEGDVFQQSIGGNRQGRYKYRKGGSIFQDGGEYEEEDYDEMFDSDKPYQEEPEQVVQYAPAPQYTFFGDDQDVNKRELEKLMLDFNDSDFSYITSPDTSYSNSNTNDIKYRQMMTESGGNPNAIGPETRRYGKAKGLYQFIDDTWKLYRPSPDASPFDPKASEIARDNYMKDLTNRYNGDVAKALAAYNAGPGRVDRAIKRYGNNWKQDLPTETKGYLKKILG
jgi:hypothetical protein